MTDSTKVEKLYNSLADTEDPFNREHILSVLYTRIAGGLESGEIGSDTIGFSGPDAAWGIVNKYLFGLAEKDPEKAFLAAVDLTLLPKSRDERQETINQWMRTSGLTLLGLEENRKTLGKYLEQGKSGNELVDVLITNIKQDTSSFNTADDFHNPLGFTTIQSIYIGLGLKNNEGETAQSIFRLAESRKDEPEVLHAVGILKTFPGCEYFGNRF